jgi:hypothetical protein
MTDGFRALGMIALGVIHMIAGAIFDMPHLYTQANVWLAAAIIYGRIARSDPEA